MFLQDNNSRAVIRLLHIDFPFKNDISRGSFICGVEEVSRFTKKHKDRYTLNMLFLCRTHAILLPCRATKGL